MSGFGRGGGEGRGWRGYSERKEKEIGVSTLLR